MHGSLTVHTVPNPWFKVTTKVGAKHELIIESSSLPLGRGEAAVLGQCVRADRAWSLEPGGPGFQFAFSIY